MEDMEDMVPSAAIAGAGDTVGASGQEGPPITTGRARLVSSPRIFPAVAVAPGASPELRFCTPEVRDTILNARAPSTRAMYEGRWKLFQTWCTDHQVDLRSCPVESHRAFAQKCGNILGSPEGYSPVRNLRGCHMVVTMYSQPLLQGERRILT